MLEMLIGRCPTAGRVEDVCKCPKPTHFNYNHDQLVKTFRLVGTPPNGTFLSKMHCLCHFEGWPKYTSRLVEVVTNALLSDRAHATREAPSQNVVEPLLDDSSESLNVVSDWIQVLSMMLTCDPDNRPHAFQVLESPFWHSSVPIAADPGLASIEEMGSRRFSSPGGINTKSYREQTGILKEQGILGSLARSRSDMRSDVNKISLQLLPVRAGTGSHRTKGRRGEVLGSDASASNSPRPEGWGGGGGRKGKGMQRRKRSTSDSEIPSILRAAEVHEAILSNANRALAAPANPPASHTSHAASTDNKDSRVGSAVDVTVSHETSLEGSSGAPQSRLKSGSNPQSTNNVLGRKNCDHSSSLRVLNSDASEYKAILPPMLGSNRQRNNLTNNLFTDASSLISNISLAGEGEHDRNLGLRDRDTSAACLTTSRRNLTRNLSSLTRSRGPLMTGGGLPQSKYDILHSDNLLGAVMGIAKDNVSQSSASMSREGRRRSSHI